MFFGMTEGSDHLSALLIESRLSVISRSSKILKSSWDLNHIYLLFRKSSALSSCWHVNSRVPHYAQSASAKLAWTLAYDFIKVLQKPFSSCSLQYIYYDARGPNAGPRDIELNGAVDSLEPFILRLTYLSGSCKTDRKEYDTVVCTILRNNTDSGGCWPIFATVFPLNASHCGSGCCPNTLACVNNPDVFIANACSPDGSYLHLTHA